MVDLGPFLEAPFEEASNLSFELLLGLGVALWVAVAVLGRSGVTTAAVAVYLLLIPGYVGYRVRVWEEVDEGDGDESDTGADDGGSGDEVPDTDETDADRTDETDSDGDDADGGDGSGRRRP